MPLSSLLFALMKKSWKLQTNPFDKVRPFCTLITSPTSASRKRWSYSFDDDEFEAESSVYKHALKFQRPSTINYYAQPVNSVSLIGTIDRELRRVNSQKEFGVHTMLKVKAFPQSNHSFGVLLKMWDELAEVSVNHLKPNDFVYVRGFLGSYMKADNNGDPRMFYEVVVKEINYVAEDAEKPMHHEPKKLDLQGYLERERNHLHLWQVFFANPHDWRDLRGHKENPKQPDFKHKGTGEALWLWRNDPPWVKRQLQLLDSELAGVKLGRRGTSFTSHLSLLVDDNIEGIGEI